MNADNRSHTISTLAPEQGAFRPQVIEQPDAGFAEFILRDCACYSREFDNGLAVIYDLKTNEAIGVRWPIPFSNLGDG